MTYQEFELYIIISRHCNFHCLHCLNSSGPQITESPLSDLEIQHIAKTIQTHPNIQSINFTGGEPSLFIPTLKKIQNQIKRTINYCITTNGWLGENVQNLFNSVKINEIILSYDQWHAPFIRVSTLVKLIRCALSNQIPVLLNFVFNDLSELVLAKPLVDAGAQLQCTKLIKSGRAQFIQQDYFYDHHAYTGTCSSLEAQQSRNHLHKIVYHPKRGFSICCGPLVFDEKYAQDVCFKNIQDLKNSIFYKRMSSYTLEEQCNLTQKTLSNFSYTSRCEACTFLHCPQSFNQPSIPKQSHKNFLSMNGINPTTERMRN